MGPQPCESIARIADRQNYGHETANAALVVQNINFRHMRSFCGVEPRLDA